MTRPPRALLVPIVALAATAPARGDDAAPGPADPIAVVGAYDLTLRWTGCAPPGARAATVELAAIDGRLEVDLAPVRDGLSRLGLAGDARALAGQADDVSASLTWGRRKIAVAIDLASGCRGRGTARRRAVGIAACDELVALARIEAGCSAIAPDARTEDVAALAGELAGAGALRGARKRALGDTCAARVTALRPTLVDAACVAVPADEAPTLIEECRDLAQRIDQLSRCRALPADARTALRDMLGQVSIEVTTSDPDQIYVARQVCVRQGEVFRQIAARTRCP